MNKIFVIADPHHGHSNIIKYENRPFANIDEMDNKLIENWNRVVSKDDKIYVLGDFSFYGKDKTKEIISKLNGIKYLVKGNHDCHSNDWYREIGFHEVYDKPIILNDWFVLSHEPSAYVSSNVPYFWIFGHVHSNPMYVTISKRNACVSCERWGYAPVELSKLVEISEGDKDTKLS